MLLRLIALAVGAFRLLKLNSGLHFKNSESQGFKQGGWLKIGTEMNLPNSDLLPAHTYPKHPPVH